MELEDTQAAGELLSSNGEPRSGSTESQESLIQLVQSRFPNKGFCIVQQWTIVRAIASDTDLTKIHLHGHLPLFVFAEKVILDSRGRFDYGNWVRSTMAISFQDGFLFETKNTVYVLAGDGDEKSASLASILSLYQ
ncbi:DUF6957 family protein [Pseudomonas moorei]|uniref:DUF6957 domain-containing protein n=1 Tax=Pseudomonas moorei TaxID=395599 RepID=A0A1H1IC61_9PSED|nr:hypothetical protein [Pseudomonas moorei]KAB0508981.1 hypothetical protein F7R06_03625 [Pseudomonas moorei]SDR35325.1 hypothetical protein SAMN04490195_5204 [Pseudomonas moorei]